MRPSLPRRAGRPRLSLWHSASKPTPAVYSTVSALSPLTHQTRVFITKLRIVCPQTLNGPGRDRISQFGALTPVCQAISSKCLLHVWALPA